MGYSKCAAPNCATKHGQGKIFKKFPTDNEVARLWRSKLPVGFAVKEDAAFCEMHFELSEFERIREDGKKKLKAKAVPSLFILTLPKPRRVLGEVTNLLIDGPGQPASAKTTSPPRSSNLLALEHSYCRSAATVKASFLEACHIGSEHQKNSTTSKSTQVLRPEECELLPFSEKSIAPTDPDESIQLSSPHKKSQIEELAPTEPEPSIESTYLEARIKQVEPKPNIRQTEPRIVSEGRLLCPKSGLFSGEESNGDQDLCQDERITTLDEALRLIASQRAKISTLENLALKGSETLMNSQIISTPSESHTAEDQQFVKISKVTQANILSVLSTQAQEIQRLTRVLKEESATATTLKKLLINGTALKRKYLALKKVNARLNKKIQNATFSPWLTASQQVLLTRRNARGVKWSPHLIRAGLIKKMECGTSGYSSFVRDYPILPSVRTLQENIQFITFQSGMLEQMFDLLETFAKHCPLHEKDCQIIADEMAIEEGEHYDHSTQKVVGNSTFPTHVGRAKKGLVIMLAGICKRWKMTVAIYFTSEKALNLKKKGCHNNDNETGKAYLDILLEIARKAEVAGLRVSGITSDMGPDNLAFWKAAGITGGKKEDVVCSVPNPARPGARMFVCPDIIHVFKAIKNGMEANSKIFLPEDIVKGEGLPSNIVDYMHVQDLYEYEEHKEVKVAFRLKPDNILCTNQYKKMRTASAKSVISHRTGVGLNLLAKETGNPNYQTTAWFIILLNTFFELLTGRSKQLALNPSNTTMYNAAIDMIKKVQHIFRFMKVGGGEWKPFQRGIRVLCASVLGLQQYFLRRGNIVTFS